MSRASRRARRRRTDSPADWVFERLVAVPGAESVEVREARLSTLTGTWLLLVFEVAWSQVGGISASVILHAWWAVLWIAVDAALQAVRIALKVRRGRALDAGESPPHRASVFANISWFAVLAAGAFGCLLSREPRLVVIALILLVGWIGDIVSRYAAFPRLAVGLMSLLGTTLTVGLATLPGMWWIGLLLVPGGVFALYLVTMENHWILLEALTAKEEHRRLSMHDPLTRLPNRLMLYEWFSGVTAAEGDPNRPEGLAVLCLDLDGFKPVNDNLGHAAGDRLLQEISKRLRTAVRSHDLLCRVGGDEFVVVMPRTDQEGAVGLAQRIIAATDAPFDVDPAGASDVRIGISVGIAVSPSTDCDPDHLLYQADTALYQSKGAGKGTWTVFQAAAPSAPAIPA